MLSTHWMVKQLIKYYNIAIINIIYIFIIYCQGKGPWVQRQRQKACGDDGALGRDFFQSRLWPTLHNKLVTIKFEQATQKLSLSIDLDIPLEVSLLPESLLQLSSWAKEVSLTIPATHGKLHFFINLNKLRTRRELSFLNLLGK